MAPKKKRRYKYILQMPSSEKQTGWQDVVMDVDRMNALLEAAQHIPERLQKRDPKKKKKHSQILRGGQEVPMDIDKINASLEMTQKV